MDVSTDGGTDPLDAYAPTSFVSRLCGPGDAWRELPTWPGVFGRLIADVRPMFFGHVVVDEAQPTGIADRRLVQDLDRLTAPVSPDPGDADASPGARAEQDEAHDVPLSTGEAATDLDLAATRHSVNRAWRAFNLE